VADSSKPTMTRRTAVQAVGAVGLGMLAPVPPHAEAARGDAPPTEPADARQIIRDRVFDTPMVDTHEHLLEESERLQGPAHPRVRCDDWALLLSHYLNSDLLVAGMPQAQLDRLLSPDITPLDKWALLEPHWPAVKNTGYAQAVRLAMRELYEVPDLSADTVAAVQAGYEKTRRPGFYHHLLTKVAKLESVQVNNLTGEPFKRSVMPTLLMQDLSILGMVRGPDIAKHSEPTGIEVKDLSDWHRVVRWWFDQYGRYAVAVKSQHAYQRDINYARVEAEQVEAIFKKVIEGARLRPDEQKQLEDHLFWYAVDQATAHDLPVKLHTGYYAGQNHMPLARLRDNIASACELCRLSPQTRFVFMHLGYPYYEETLALAKHWTNAYVDMCWAWIINPIAAKDYLKKHLVTAPLNKLFPFGGDYLPVEPVVGHAIMARQGITQALSELVEENWLTLDDALQIIDPLLHGNARQLFNLEQKTKILRQAPWL